MTLKRNSRFLPAKFGKAQRRAPLGLMTLSVTTLAALCLGSPAAQAQSYIETTLYSFGTNSNDGQNSTAGLLNVNGILYGTLTQGGSNFNGAVFSINPSTKAESIVYSFGTNNNDGDYPLGGLINVGGTLYGTSNQAGLNNNSSGTVYSINPSNGNEATVYNFQGGVTASDGELPRANLLNVSGTLYGTTSGGGSSSDGTIFSINPTNGTETVLHTFTGNTKNSDGSYPSSDLINVNGVLYGTTETGGAHNFGSVFSIKPDGTGYQTIYSFNSGNSDGNAPSAGLVDLTVNGTESLYGTTAGGGPNSGGTIYSINLSSHAEQLIHTFGANTDGSDPLSNLVVLNGLLYGTTASGGANNEGTVFSIDPSSQSEGVVWSFAGTSDGSSPQAGLTIVNGVLYGTTNNGGTNGYGTVFSLTPVGPPTANTDGCTIYLNTARTNAAPGVLGNDLNGGEGPLTATLITNVSHGTLNLHSDGSFTYTPNTGYMGKDVFTYRVANPLYQGNTTTCTFNVVPALPIARNDGCSIAYNKARTNAAPGVLSNDSNGGAASLTALLVSNVSHGSLTLNSNGSFTYTPNDGFAGPDTFTYRAVNSTGQSNVATVTLTVIATTPTAHNDGCTIAHNTARTIAAPGVLFNDDSGGDPMTAILINSVSHGTLNFHSDGSFTYTPNTGYSGTDTFTYRPVNSVGQGTLGTVTLTVQ